MTDAATDLVLSHAVRAALEQRLEQWGEEYLNFRDVEGAGRNILQVLIDHKGYIPRAKGGRSIYDRTPAEEVNDIVDSMRNAGWWLHATILRMDYWRPEPPMERRLEILAARGCVVSRTGYFTKLAEAKFWVAGALFRGGVAVRTGKA